MDSESEENQLSQSSNSNIENDDSQILKKKRPKILGKRVIKNQKPKKIKTLYNKYDYGLEKSTDYRKLAQEKFLYRPFIPLPDLSEYLGNIIEIRVAAEYLSQNNKAFIEKRIWGSDIYTSDSDVVCILQHSGYFLIKELIPTNLDGVSVYFRVLKGRTIYNTSFKNGIKSKKLHNYLGHSIKPENYTILTNGLGMKLELEEMASKMPNIIEYTRKKNTPNKIYETYLHRDYNLTSNLSFEIALAYSLSTISDKSRDSKDFISWKLRDHVLYLETNSQRFEIARNVCDYTNDDYLFEEYETFRFSEVLDPITKDNDFMLENTIPLQENYVKVIFDKLDWHEMEWGENSLLVKTQDIKSKINLKLDLKSFKYYTCTNGKK